MSVPPTTPKDTVRQARKDTKEISSSAEVERIVLERVAALEKENASLRQEIASLKQTDITEHKLAEHALEESSQHLSAMVQGSPVPTFVIDRHHNIIFWNHALEVYSGINADAMIGRPMAWKAFYSYERPTLADLIVDGAADLIPRWYGGSMRSLHWLMMHMKQQTSSPR
jgi:PAS domain-containing protein